MRPDDPNLPYLILIAKALGELREELVFVGGCAAGLLLTDPAAESVRATQDVDAIVEAATLVQFYRVEAELPGKGFVRDMESSVICRWRHRESAVLFDLMPVDPSVLGFANRWYPQAVQTAVRVTLGDDLQIRLIAAPAFVATKLEAFASRGHRDFMSSHDLEDVLNVIDGRPEFIDEARGATDDLRNFIGGEIAALIAQPDFANCLPGLIADEDRAGVVMARLRALAAFPRE